MQRITISKNSISKNNKNLRYFIWTIGLLIVMSVFVTATGILTDQKINVPTGNFTSINSSIINNIYYVTPSSFSNLQSVINSAPDNSKIVVPAGTYNINPALNISNKNNIYIKFEEGAIITTGVTFGTVSVNILNSSYITIDGGKFMFADRNTWFEIADNSNGQSINSITVKNAYFERSVNLFKIKAYGLNSKINQINFLNNEFNNISATTLSFNYAEPAGNVNGSIQNVLIADNYFHGNSSHVNGHSSMNFGSRYSVSSQSNVIIRNNKFIDFTAIGDTTMISLRRSSNNKNFLIEGNMLKDIHVIGTHYAMGIGSYRTNSLQILNNHCENIWYDGTGDSESHCIVDSDDGDEANNLSTHVLISGNFMKNITSGATGSNKKDGEGIYCKAIDCKITNNMLIDAGTGYAISQVGGYSYDCDTSGNTIIYNTYSPLLAGIRSHCANQTISNNIFRNVGAVPAILIGGAGYTIFTNNYINGAKSVIGTIGSSNATGDNLYVANNRYAGITATTTSLYSVTGWDSVDYFNNVGETGTVTSTLAPKQSNFFNQIMKNVGFFWNDPADEEDLYAYFPFTNGELIDYTNINSDGILANITQSSNGFIGDGYTFNGINQSITTSIDFPLENCNTTGMSFSFWFKTSELNPASDQFLFGQDYARFGCSIGTSYLSCYSRNLTDVQIAYSVDTNNALYGTNLENTWVHIAFIVNSTYKMLYINGQPTIQGSGGTALLTGGYNLASNQPLRIGGRSDGVNLFNGSIDELKIYNRTLTYAEIQAEYSKNTPSYPARMPIKFNQLRDYPTYCPDGTFVRGVNDSLSCSTGSSNINVTNITQQTNGKHCFDGSTCNVYQYYNGSTLITKVN